MKSKKIIIWLIVALIILGILLGVILHLRDGIKLVSVKSEKELMSIYEGRTETRNDILLGLVTMPFSFMPYGIISPLDPWEDYYETEGPFDGIATNSPTTSNSSSLWDRTQLNGSNSTETSEKEHSTTNIQVENVDEADITKTDGNYIYSISGASVVITNVKDPANIKMEAVITPTDDYVPEDLILYNNKLVVISTHYINYSKSDTYVNVYDITTKDKPKLVENYTYMKSIILLDVLMANYM